MRIPALCLAAALATAPLLAATAEKTEELSWDVERGLAIAVDTHNGDVKLRKSRDAKLHVRAIKSAEQRLNGHGRLVIRPSGTETVIRVMGEGDDKSLVEDVVDGIVEVLADAAA